MNGEHPAVNYAGSENPADEYDQEACQKYTIWQAGY